MDKRERVWSKAAPIPGRNPDVWRRDALGNKIRNDSYGSRRAFGWAIGHIRPIRQGGTNDVDNLQAIHWEEYREKIDFYLYD